MSQSIPKLALVAPVYNEEAVLKESTSSLTNILKGLIEKKLISPDSFLVLCNDGSKDKSWEMICEIASQNPYVSGLHLGTNRGQEPAILAGLFEMDADIYIPLDIDLQDDITKIEEMVEEYKQGNDIVFGVRNDRSKDSLFKRWSANTYYALMRFWKVPMLSQHSEFRLMTRRVIDTLKIQYPERNLFLRATVLSLGFKSSIVYYKRQKRMAGKSKYHLFKLIRLVLNGITAYSTKLLNIIIIGALVFIGISLLMFAYIVYSLIVGKNVSGWASIFASLYFIGGSIMASLAILAEYIARIYTETKRRPHYIITQKTPPISKKHEY